MGKQRHYISVPVREYESLEKAFKDSEKDKERLMELLDAKENIVIFKSTNSFWRGFNEFIYLSTPFKEMKQQELISELDKKVEEIRDHQKTLENKYEVVPDFIVFLFSLLKKS